MPRPVRSTRAAQSNKKYTVDAFDQYRDLLLEPSSDDEQPQADHIDNEEPSDGDFDETNAAEELAQAAAETSDESEDDVAEDGEIALEDEVVAVGEDEVAAVAEDQPEPQQTTATKPKLSKHAMRKKAIAKKMSEHITHNDPPIFESLGNIAAKGRNVSYSRGIPEVLHHQSRGGRLLFSLGTAQEDLVAHIIARDRWLNDATIPYRKHHRGDFGGGLARSTFYPEEKWQKEANEGMQWYYEEGGQQAFEKYQVCNTVEPDHAPNSCSKSDNIVAGPIDGQQIFGGIEPNQIWNLSDAYTGTSKSSEDQSWILNAGANVQSLEWCPNQHGISQFLAIGTKVSYPDTEANLDATAPAYANEAQRCSCLQLWEVRASEAGAQVGDKIHFDQKPILRRVVSTNWGYIRKMRWCPMPDRDAEGQHRLGFLAAVFADGKLRILDISMSTGESSAPEYVHIERTAIEVQAPDTLFTCLTWLSSRTIAAGTADGCLSIYSLPEALAQASSATSETRPWFYQRLNQAYIQSISSGYPSRPHMIFISSLDGYLSATDLRSPSFDTVTAQRSRIAQGHIVWHDLTQSAFNVDDNFTMKAYGVRTFYKATTVARFTALATDFAASPVHSSFIVGCADGSVFVTNPMRRLRDHKQRPLVQCVFKHEWRRPVQDNDGDMNITDPILSKPLIRLMTGFKIQTADTNQENRTNAHKDYVSFATVYEEKTAVTQVAWNPNLRAGTWAAMGMASGLVVVRDLAAD